MHSITIVKTRLDQLIDGVTMYMMVVYALLGLVISSLICGMLGLVPQTMTEQALSLLVVVASAFIVNSLFAKIFSVTPNYQSVIITALILFFVVNPAREISELYIIALSAGIAMASKYIISFRKQHIINPAAVGVAALSVSGLYEPTWWIATPVLLLPLLIAGFFVVYKIRKWVPVLSFLGVGLLVFALEEWQFTGSLANVETFFISYPALFLAFFMLTEPFTMPPTKKQQALYGAGVGVLAHTTLLMPVITMSPELALIIGNIAVYPFTLKRKLILRLQERRTIATDTYEFVFEKPAGVTFTAGQYLEWMIPHADADSRGQRRYFTIASSPNESSLLLACKFVEGGSSYKRKLMSLQPGDTIIASQLAGDFTLPHEPAKIGMIAGGIGVTPFRSQVQYMLDVAAHNETVLFYCANSKADIAYTSLWERASTEQGMVTVPVFAKEAPGNGYETGFMSHAILTKHASDYKERIWYISGPPVLVRTATEMLRKAGVPKKHIIRDFFPGLA